MSYRILDVCGLGIERVEHSAACLMLHFDSAKIEKVMDNADQRTLWTQAGTLEIDTPRLAEPWPDPPFVVVHASLQDSLYTQLDMIRIPLEMSGEVTLELTLEGIAQHCVVEGSAARLQLIEKARYVRHLD